MANLNDKRVFNPINLSKLPAPDVVETLDYELILQEMLADLRQRDPQFSATVESDPAYKILEVAAYRETLLRQRVNDAARSVMLGYAGGGDLDNLAAFFGVERLEGEADSRLRTRAQLAIEGYTTAGPVGAYVFHGLSASELVKDIDVSSPSPGEVVVTVLSTEDDGMPAADVLAAVDAALNDDDVRPLTDHAHRSRHRASPHDHLLHRRGLAVHVRGPGLRNRPPARRRPGPDVHHRAPQTRPRHQHQRPARGAAHRRRRATRRARRARPNPRRRAAASRL